MTDPTTIRQRAIEAAEAAERELDEALCSTGDTLVTALGMYQHRTGPQPQDRMLDLMLRAAAARVLVRRNAMRSDNAL